MTKTADPSRPEPVPEEEPPAARRRFEDLPPAAQRALQEADARKKAASQQQSGAPAEIGGRGGSDPARFGDWEIGGRAIDF